MTWLRTFRSNRILVAIVVVLATGFLFHCDVRVYQPDKTQPSIDLTWPPDSSLIGQDTITVQTEVNDNIAVQRVEFFVDKKLDTAAVDSTPPYTYLLDFGVDTIRHGTRHHVFAKAFDFENNEMMSNILTLDYGWQVLGTDQDDDFGKSIDDISDFDRLLVRSTSDSLSFRVETHQRWEDATDTTSIINTAINTAIFLDIDQDTSTGMPPSLVNTEEYTGRTLKASTPGDRYSPGLIGPDYAMVFGLEGDSLWHWNQSDTLWETVGPLGTITFKNDTSVAEFSISKDLLNGNSQVDVRAISVIMKGSSTWYDWIPDVGAFTVRVEDVRILETE